MLFKIFKLLKKPLIKIYHFLINFFWRIRITHHNTFPLNRSYFPYKKIHVSYDLKSQKIKNNSQIEIYKIKNLYKPANNYIFFSNRNKSFISENWIYNIATRIGKKRRNININLQDFKRINLKKPVFFITSTDVYAQFIWWNIFNILLLIKNKILFDIVVHENLNKTASFNKNFVNFLKKYFNLKIIYLNPDKNLLIESNTLYFNNYRKEIIYNINKPKQDYFIFPKEIFNDLPKLVIYNKKLKKFFGKPRNDIVLISREDSRIIKNEKELLKKIPNIKRIVPEKLSIEEQISFAYHAKIIITAYGSAITNIFFSRPGCTLIRLAFNKTNNLDTKDDLHSNYSVYEMMAESRGMKYYIQNHGDFFGTSQQKKSYFYVDINKLEQLLKKII